MTRLVSAAILFCSLPFLSGSADAQNAPISTSSVQSLGCIDYDWKLSHQDCTAVASIDLTTAFHTPDKWSLVITQGNSDPDVPFAIGQLTFCFIKGSQPECGVTGDDIKPGDIERLSKYNLDEMIFNHLDSVNVTYPSPKAKTPILVAVTRDYAGGPGDGRYYVTIWGYDPYKRLFKQIFYNSSYGNVMEETRIVTAGPLAGYVVVDNANVTGRWPWPFGILVYKFVDPDYFVRVLSFVGKANQAGGWPDGNVIDIETPEILRRLHLKSR